MTPKTTEISARTTQYAIGYADELMDGLTPTLPNALQAAVMDSLSAISTLSHNLGVTLPEHHGLYSYLAENWSELPTSLSPDSERVMLDALHQLNSTRETLQKVWISRAAEADGFWFDGKQYAGEIPEDVWKRSAQYRTHNIQQI
ncbi:hypothetical protein [Pseudomonas tohonis]|uniref:hypothetical protein n=1 Tax=Pseudomonas tohonis TaxID=2725477 RepID=UPI00255C1985|nr:hypothetical protein [Pseudomonas tohonis]